MSRIQFPWMRLQVMAAVESLSDPVQQQTRWGRVEEGVNHYDDLTLNVSILYDDTMVLPDPGDAVPALLHENEVPAFQELYAVLEPLLQDLGELPDAAYLSDPRWTTVVHAAQVALAAMCANDQAEPQMTGLP